MSLFLSSNHSNPLRRRRQLTILCRRRRRPYCSSHLSTQITVLPFQRFHCFHDKKQKN